MPRLVVRLCGYIPSGVLGWNEEYSEVDLSFASLPHRHSTSYAAVCITTFIYRHRAAYAVSSHVACVARLTPSDKPQATYACCVMRSLHSAQAADHRQAVHAYRHAYLPAHHAYNHGGLARWSGQV